MKRYRLFCAVYALLIVGVVSCSGSGTPVAPIIGRSSPEPTSAVTATPTIAPTSSPSAVVASPSPSPSVSATASPKPTPTATAVATATPTPTPSSTPTLAATATPGPTGSPIGGYQPQTVPCRYSTNDNSPGSFFCAGGEGNDPSVGLSVGAYLSNATGDPTQLSQVSFAQTFSRTAPANLKLVGPFIVDATGILSDSPATITYDTSGSGTLNFQMQYIGTSPATSGLPPENSPITCALYEDSTFIADKVGYVTNDQVVCFAQSNPFYANQQANATYLTLPTHIDVGHPYTMVITQGTPAPSPSP